MFTLASSVFRGYRDVAKSLERLGYLTWRFAMPRLGCTVVVIYSSPSPQKLGKCLKKKKKKSPQEDIRFGYKACLPVVPYLC